jgi:hypothetical protein
LALRRIQARPVQEVVMAEATVGSPLSMHDPRTVGPWQILSRLGAGGMGVVFYATDGSQHAAVKVIRPGLLDTAGTRDRFRREVQVLRSVRDRHICRYLDAELESEPAWLALEYLSGPVLRDEVARNGPVEEQAWWELAAGLAQALSVLAERRVTHRDLKPGNVILSERGPVLIDFGIANPEDATSLTATGLVTGSPAWLSPEQANLEPTGPATDVFTLGSLLAFAATGRPPFGEGASVAVLMSIIKRDPDLTGIDPVRARFLRGLLTKDPTMRPTAREVLESARAGADGTLALRPGADPTLIAPPPPQAPPRPDAAPEPVAGAQDTRAAAPPAPRGAPAPPPPRPGGPGPVRPRTAAAQRRRATRRRTFLVVVAAVLIAILGWLLLRDTGAPQGAGLAGGPAPAAPASDQLRSGDWLLESYRLDNNEAGLVVSATVRNTGEASASADLVVWVYADSDPLGSVATTVTDVGGGVAVPVTMRGDAVWRAGPKTVLLEAS